uniref:4'-phosphopantetheine phosphatase n=1 Tax=Strigamia maritima TaxID=126957 RepID=T1INC0_STRMM
MTGKSEAQSIVLPEGDLIFRNLRKAKRFAIDIGGSLTKIAYYSTVAYRRARYSITSIDEGTKSDEDSCDEVSERARLHFIKFETKYIENCLTFIEKNLIGSKEFMRGKSIKATGGGSYRYTDLITNKLGLTVDKEDEMSCLIMGCNFLLKNIPDEIFTYQRHGNPEYQFITSEPNLFPYLLVNIGSGVSIMKAESEVKYERIGGSSLGGGTFWGLGSLLTKAKGFDDLLQLAEMGDHRNLDMLVKDIYGGDYDILGLPGDLIASSFGKAIRSEKDKHFDPAQFSESDIVRSLLYTISNDIGQIASLYAILHDLKRVYFGGYFLRGHPISMHAISFAINFWSKGKVQALFLRHEGYLGAIGAFLKATEEYGDVFLDADKYSWSENYAGSSGLQSPLPTQKVFNTDLGLGMFEMDSFDTQLVYCPLLADPSTYVADAVDLTTDKDARDYWLQCFEDATDKFVAQAISSQPNTDDAAARASKFRDKYLNRLKHLREQPFAYGSLTVRSLLDMREHCLNEFDFPDPYFQQKQFENESALRSLSARLAYLDSLPWGEKQEALITGVLAGNVFDWGAREVAVLLEGAKFGFEEAVTNLEPRPWLVDNLDKWLNRLKIGPPHKCAAIFVDNSGIDIVMGIIPFVRELIARKTKVILCANSRPALNDVTYCELTVLMKQVATISNEISEALLHDQLLIMDSGQGSPCLDLSRLQEDVAKAMVDEQVELLVLEGMGRAVHTNLNATFVCETLKLAVLKNKWLASRLGGKMFSVMCKYEKPKT